MKKKKTDEPEIKESVQKEEKKEENIKVEESSLNNKPEIEEETNKETEIEKNIENIDIKQEENNKDVTSKNIKEEIKLNQEELPNSKNSSEDKKKNLDNNKKLKNKTKESLTNEKNKKEELTIQQMNKEITRIAKFGSKAKNQNVQNNIARATQMSFELIRKCTNLKKQKEKYDKNEKSFKQLQSKYLESSSIKEETVKDLESIVETLRIENEMLKKLFESNKINIPIVEEAFPKPKVKQQTLKSNPKNSQKDNQTQNKTNKQLNKGSQQTKKKGKDNKPQKKEEKTKEDPIIPESANDFDWAA